MRTPFAVAVAILACSMPLSAGSGSACPVAELHEAARSGNVAQLQALLDAGCPVDIAARHEVTALRLAADQGHRDAVVLLLDRGADPNRLETFFGSSIVDAAGKHPEIVRLLLSRGVTDGVSALGQAIEADDPELARLALAKGIAPLDLAVARRAVTEKSEALRAVLTAAEPGPRPARATGLDPGRLSAFAMRYRGRDVELEAQVQGDGLLLQLPEGESVAVFATGARTFENQDGTMRFEVAGRAGLVEWAQLVKASGETLFLSASQTGEVGELAATAAPPEALMRTTPAGSAQPWRQFRGAGAAGIGDAQGAPATWDVATGHNVRFKTAIPGIALASPIIDQGRIFVATTVSAKGDTTFRTGLYGDGTSVDDTSEHSFRLYALDATSGKIVWEREVAKTAPTVRRHLKSSLANSTPVTDGERIVVLFGTVGVLATYDRDGKELWRRQIPVLEANDPQSGTAEWGHASSPVIWNDRVFVQADMRRDSFLAAYRLSDGAEIWNVSRAEPSTWSTPTIVSSPRGDELVTNGTTIRAYRPETGELLWSLGPNSEVVVATPVAGEGMAYVTAGYPPVRPVYAIRAGSRGDLTLADDASSSAAVAWSHNRGGTYLPTPILYRGHFVTLNNNGILTAYRASDGAEVHRARVGASGTSFTASPVAADGRLYLISEEGDVFVIRGEPGYELLTKVSMGEVVMATPAISDGLMVVRTLGHIVGLGEAVGSGGITATH
jgi:outer membrane protein assembly factor BamB